MSLEEFLSEWNNDSPFVHVQTSGSTGVPKPMLAEKRRMLASARITNDFLGLREGDVALLCMSLDYIAGKMMVVRSMERGLKLLTVEPSGHPLNYCQSAIDDCKIDFAAMVPMQVYNTLQVPEERERLMGIRHLIIGGRALELNKQDHLVLGRVEHLLESRTVFEAFSQPFKFFYHVAGLTARGLQVAAGVVKRLVTVFPR